MDGRVVEIKKRPGDSVTPGEVVAVVEPESAELEPVVYVNSTTGKDIRAGMDAQVSPSTVKREEYGFMVAKITSVGEYPVTPEAVRAAVANNALADEFIGSSAKIEIRARLAPDGGDAERLPVVVVDRPGIPDSERHAGACVGGHRPPGADHPGAADPAARGRAVGEAWQMHGARRVKGKGRRDKGSNSRLIARVQALARSLAATSLAHAHVVGAVRAWLRDLRLCLSSSNGCGPRGCLPRQPPGCGRRHDTS